MASTKIQVSNLGVNLLVQWLNNNNFTEKTGQCITAGLLVGNLERCHLKGDREPPKPPRLQDSHPDFPQKNAEYVEAFAAWSDVEAAPIDLDDKQFTVCQLAARAHTKAQTYRANVHSARVLQELKLDTD